MADLNSISSSNDYPADGYGYVPTRAKSEENQSKEDKEIETIDRDIVPPLLDMATKLRDLSDNLNILQEKLIPLEQGEEREKFLKQVKENQIAMENLCSMTDGLANPIESMASITELLNNSSLQTSSSAVTRLLGED